MEIVPFRIITYENPSDFICECDEGWYEVEGTDFCCPEPNMEIIDGYCESLP